MTRAHAPASLSEALAVLVENPNARPVAGCTDLMVGAGEGRAAFDAVLDLTRIPEIHGIMREADGWRIGATATFTEIQRAPGLAASLPILAEAASWVGGWQIQNRATIGGNAANASPAGDSLPVLLALDAAVVLVGPRGERTVPYDAFHLAYRRTAIQPGEILAWILVPEPAPGTIQFFRKIGTREAQSISKVVVAMAARRDGGALRDVRIAAGSVAPVPVRLRAAEAACEGRDTGEATAVAAGRAAAGEVAPIDDVRSTAAYRAHVLERTVRRMILRAGEA